MNSVQVKELVRQIDQIILETANMFESDQLIVFSDHGMLEVKGLIDVLNLVKKVGCLGKDFVVFLDSIMARFWVYKEYLLDYIAESLSSELNGQIFILDKDEIWNRFGNLLFIAMPGYLIYPNYYNKKPPRAMHGYKIPLQSYSPLNGILFTANIPNLILPERLFMADLYAILKRALEID
jgi:hypothetical protein